MKTIDIAKVLADKNPKLARWIPRFMVRWVEKFVAADKHNEILALYGSCSPAGFLDGALGYIGVKYEIFGAENIPESGGVLFAANHPLGGVDGMILAAAINPIRAGVKLIVNDILLNVEPLRPIFVGVNKHGSQNSLGERLDALYASDSPIINFPAGFCSRLGSHGKIEDIAWKKNFVPRCINSGRVVVPTYVKARNSKMFYKIERWRAKLGIKLNIGMLMLPREVFYQKGKTVQIYFGTPIELDFSKTYGEWCDLIRSKVYEMER